MSDPQDENKKALSLQKRAAACADELLDITNEIGKSVIGAYKETKNSFFELSAKLQMGRLEHLKGELEEIKTSLDELDIKALSDERAGSVGITRQVIIQDLALADEKLRLLKEMLISDARAKEALAAASKLEDTAQVIRLGNTLRKELGKCESEK